MITPTILRRGSHGRLAEAARHRSSRSCRRPPRRMPSPAPWNPGALAAGRRRAAGAAAGASAAPRSRRRPPRVSGAEPVAAVGPEPRSGSSQSAKLTKAQRAGGRAGDEGRGEAARSRHARQAEADRKKAAGDGPSRRQARRRGPSQGREGRARSRQSCRPRSTAARPKPPSARPSSTRRAAEQRAIAQAKLDAARQQYEQQVAKIQAENRTAVTTASRAHGLHGSVRA